MRRGCFLLHVISTQSLWPVNRFFFNLIRKALQYPQMSQSNLWNALLILKIKSQSPLALPFLRLTSCLEKNRFLFITQTDFWSRISIIVPLVPFIWSLLVPRVSSYSGLDTCLHFWDIRALKSPLMKVSSHSHWVTSVAYNWYLNYTYDLFTWPTCPIHQHWRNRKPSQRYFHFLCRLSFKRRWGWLRL